jgi:GNAT superfamily N-acetyltransferase
MLRLLDAAIIWLNARGGGRQWGSVPFSTNRAMVEYLAAVANAGEVRIAHDAAQAVVGGYILGERPEYAPATTESERYIEAMVSDRALAGQRIGTLLVEDAIACSKATGAVSLRTDCWAEANRLIQWYEQHGFTRRERIAVAGWPAQMLHMPLTPPTPAFA